MTDMLARMEPGAFIGLVAVAGALLCGIVGIVMGCWVEMRRVTTSNALKLEMLERGMSADEIRTVLEAGSKQCRSEHAHSRSC